MVHEDSTQNVCLRCETVHTSIDCPVCFPGRFAVAVDKLFGFHRPLPFVAALLVGLSVSGAAVGQQASSATYIPPSSFQVVEIGDRSEAVGWPHRFTRVEARGMSRELSRVFRREYRPFTTYPSHRRAVRAVCVTSGRVFACRLVDRGGRGVARVGVERVWEDGSVRVVWPQAPMIRVVVSR
jgi:hypothetical protein